MSYSAAISKERAAKLQALCASRGLTSMIFTVGLDCNRNKVNTQVFNWLFKGITGTHALENSGLDFDYEEIAWIVTPDSFEIYIGGVTGDLELTNRVYEEIMDITISWKGVNVYLASEADLNDADIGEATKVLWFVRRMKKLLGPTGACADNVEKWPIVQAYALDFFESGFFSMKHPVVDISSDIVSFFNELDPAAVYIITNEHMPRLSRNFKEASDIINKGNRPINRKLVKIESVANCLTIPFEYALLQKSDIGKRPSVGFQGNVVNDFEYVVLKGVCGDTALECYRTWFFEKGLKEALLDQENSLRAVYRAIAVSVKRAIELANSPQDFQEHFTRLLSRYEYISEDIKHNAMQCTTVSWTNVDIDRNESPDGVLITFKACCTLGQVPIEYADSCLCHENRYINLTTPIEEMAVWEIDYTPKAKPEFGDMKCQIPTAELYTQGSTFVGKLTVYEQGWVFDSLRTGQMQFNMQDFTTCVKVSNMLFGFQTPTSQIWLKVPKNPNIVKTWAFDVGEGPEIPNDAEPWDVYRGVAPHELGVETGVPVHIITGPPGAGKRKFAAQLARREWKIVAPDFPNSIMASGYQIPEVSEPSIIVVPALSSWTLPRNVSVRSVIVKINSDNLYINQNREFWPCLFPQIASANTLILSDANEISEDFMKKIKLINPSIGVYRTSAQLAPTQATGILDNRRVVNTIESIPYLFPLESLYLEFDLIIDVNKLKKQLRTLNSQDVGEIPDRIKWESSMIVNYIKGTVSACEEKENLLQETFYDMTGTPKRLYTSKTNQNTAKGVLFVGRNLEKTRLINFMLQCKATYGAKIPIRTKESLSPVELGKIREALTLPEQWDTDGHFFYDPEGTRQEEHPCYEDSVSDFLEDENERIGEFNRKVQKDISMVTKSNEVTQVITTPTFATA